ncbi:MAG: hypothetical protein EOO10_07865 [Chitinophagaceae bacterium]|nr:MAG: hypothetical protein EOO10_07865 [Chitinophagaceae bacterium]
MKKRTFFTLIILVALATTVNAQEDAGVTDRKHQLGIRISSQDPVINNSISYKYFFNSSTAAEALFSFSDPVALGLLIEKHKPFGPSGLSWFWGAGAYVGFGGGRNFGAQGVVGLDFLFPTLPVNLSVDWKPELNIAKQFSFEPAAVGFSARFAF